MTQPSEGAAAGRAMSYLMSSLISLALPVFTLPIMTRWLSLEDYGIIALSQVVATLFSGLANLGVSTAIERNFFQYERDPRRLGRLMFTGCALVCAGMVGWSVVFVAVKDAVSWVVSGRQDWGAFMWCASILAVLGVLQTIQLIYLRNRGRARAYLCYSVGSALLESILAVVLVAVYRVGVWGLLLGPLIGKATLVLIGWCQLALALRPSVHVRTALELLGIGAPLAPKAVLTVADQGVDRLLVNWLNSLGQVGLFGLANRAGYAVFNVLTSIAHVYTPQVYRLMFQNGPRAGQEIGRYLSPYFYCSILVPVTAVLFSEEVLHCLVTPAFYGVKLPVVVLAAYYGQMFFGKVVGTQLLYRKKTWYSTACAAARLGAHLAFALLWVPRYGALGAAWALFASGVVVDGMSLWIAHREYPILYELKFVLPMMGLLYGSMLWVLATTVIPLPYSAVLAGKLVLYGLFLSGGMRWWPLMRTELARWLGSFSPSVAVERGSRG